MEADSRVMGTKMEIPFLFCEQSHFFQGGTFTPPYSHSPSPTLAQPARIPNKLLFANAIPVGRRRSLAPPSSQDFLFPPRDPRE